jgi:hypothetical protein
MDPTLYIFSACILRSKMYWGLFLWGECWGLGGVSIAVLSNRKHPSLYFLTIGRFRGRGVSDKLGGGLVCLSCYRLMSSFLTMVLVYCSGCLEGLFDN